MRRKCIRAHLSIRLCSRGRAAITVCVATMSCMSGLRRMPPKDAEMLGVRMSSCWSVFRGAFSIVERTLRVHLHTVPRTGTRASGRSRGMSACRGQGRAVVRRSSAPRGQTMQMIYCVKLYSKSAPSNSIFEAGALARYLTAPMRATLSTTFQTARSRKECRWRPSCVPSALVWSHEFYARGFDSKRACPHAPLIGPIS